MPILPPSSTYSGGGANDNLYLRAGQPAVLPSGSTLTSVVNLKAADGSSTGQLYVSDSTAGPYQGAVNLTPGANASAGTFQGDGVTIRTIAGAAAGSAATSVEVGANAQGPNHLYIAGLSGVGEVYDQVYNKPVSIKPITIIASDPDCVPSGVGNIFLCGQTAVAQAGAGVEQFNRFSVPRTGAYAFQTRFVMGNSGAGPNTVVLPSTLVGGVPVWNMLELVMSEFSTVNVVPFGVTEIIGGDFQAIDTFEPNSFTSRTFSTVVFLDSTKVYAIGLVSNSALWNIGTSGSISANLVAMC